MVEEWQRGDYTISTDRDRLDLDAVERFLRASYWAPERPRQLIEESVRHSLCFGLYRGERQLGFARVITDWATFAYLCDVFVDDITRGAGLGVWLMETATLHPRLVGVRIWLLATRDAHELYRKAGFGSLKTPERWMERRAGDLPPDRAP